MKYVDILYIFVLYELCHGFNLLDIYSFYHFFYIKQMALTIPFITNDKNLATRSIFYFVFLSYNVCVDDELHSHIHNNIHIHAQVSYYQYIDRKN